MGNKDLLQLFKEWITLSSAGISRYPADKMCYGWATFYPPDSDLSRRWIELSALLTTEAWTKMDKELVARAPTLNQLN